MDLPELLSFIDVNINTKTGADKITGKQHNAVLKEVITSIIDISATGYGGDLSPDDNPGLQAAPIYFSAAEKGTFTYCGGVEVSGLPSFVVWKSGAWSVINMELSQNVTNLSRCQGLVMSGDAEPQSPGENEWFVFVGGGSIAWGETEYTEPGIIYYRGSWKFIEFGQGGEGTLDHDAMVNKDAPNQHPLSSISPEQTKAKKFVIISEDGSAMVYSSFNFDQVFQFGDMDVSSWLEGEQRLALISKTDGQPALEGGAALRDIFAPPGVDALLLDQSGWENETKTLTGENFRGELGNPGQKRPLSGGTFDCISSVSGDEGGSNGSSTWVRNRTVDVLDPDSSTQDAAICDLLNPSRTGGNMDDDWDLSTNTKVLTIPAKWGTWWKDTGGYMYFCYSVSGANSYWYRNGTPQAIQAPINSTSHPVLCANLLAHDFIGGVYADQAGDEQSYWDQYFYDSVTRGYFKKINSTQWEKLR